MLRRVQSLFGFKLLATDGEIGEIHDFYFDEQSWRIRYVVAQCGSWLDRKRMLLSPTVLDTVVWEKRAFPVNVTREWLSRGPELDPTQPFSEDALISRDRYYGWPLDWVHPADSWDDASSRRIAQETAEQKAGIETAAQAKARVGDETAHLRSAREVISFQIAAEDGDIGHVKDFFFDEEDWYILYLLVDTGGVLKSKEVILSPSWIEQINWADSKVQVNMTREKVDNSPEYTPASLDRTYETSLYTYYGYTGYWV